VNSGKSRQNRPIRKFIELVPEVDRRIADLVSSCSRFGIEMDYSRSLNLFAELGVRWLEESNRDERKAYGDIFEKHLDFDRFERSGAKGYFFEYGEWHQWKEAARRRIGNESGEKHS